MATILDDTITVLEMRRVVLDGLRVRLGEVLTDELARERANNLAMALAEVVRPREARLSWIVHTARDAARSARRGDCAVAAALLCRAYHAFGTATPAIHSMRRLTRASKALASVEQRLLVAIVDAEDGRVRGRA